ncbi:MAG: phosphate acyltransferase PlsX [Holosporales bacterium]|jgi:glycerol-3-phosphate acyltransferase PlsX|nr:phosphate acyltransferase PlsX [Holosporales bacterium]
MSTIKIAIDVMGGDHGVITTIAGVVHYIISNKEDHDVFFNLFGNRLDIENALSKNQKISKNLYAIHHTEKVISNDIKLINAVKSKDGTSMCEAIKSVAKSESDAVVSSGNTGVYMAISKMFFDMIHGIDRPALMTLVPSISGRGNVGLDLGANMECTSENFLQFAIMGDAAAKAIFHIESPRVGLLNVGTEKNKGTGTLREAYLLIDAVENLDFVGFVEGTDFLMKTVDVIVTDGFSGNVAIKSMEGIMKCIASLYETEVRSSLYGKLTYMFSRGILKKIKKIIDPGKYNGASLVGLKGIAVKSHGSANSIGFSNAISVAVNLVRSNFIKTISKSIENRI